LIGRCGLETLPGSIFVTVADFATILFCITLESRGWLVRPLSFDSSLAVAVFDDRLEDGRPKEVRTFRRRLIAGRLGIPLAQLPDDPAEMVKAINQLVQRGSSRVTATLPGQPGPFTPEGEATVLDYPTSADSGPSASDSRHLEP
jgi:hypothetical protein